MSKFDDIFKERLRKTFLVALEKVFNQRFDKINAQPIEFRKQVKRKADFLFHTSLNGDNALIHIEIQTRNDPKMIKRMFTYIALLYDKYELPVKQIVLFLGKNKNIKSTMIPEKNVGLFDYRYELINISDISYEIFLENKETLIFAILGNFNGEKDVAVVEKILRKTDSFFTTEEEITEFFADLLIFSSLRKLEKQVQLQTKKPNFMPLDIDITKTLTYKQAKKIGELEGELKGELKGEIKGELKGKLEIAQIMLLDGMPTAQIQKFTKLSITQINALKDKSKS